MKLNMSTLAGPRLSCLGALAAAAALLTTLALPAQAADYPDRSVNIVVPYPPGGLVDAQARQLATLLSDKWKQTVVVENKGGAGTTIGTAQVARAKPDGYTLLFTSTGFITNQILMDSLPYDSASLTPVAIAAVAPNVLYVHPSLPVDSVQSLVDYARKNPESVKFASTGNGSSPHLSAELLSVQARMPMIHVPYRGAGPALNDLLAGHVNAMCHFPASLAQVQAGKLRVLGVASESRMAQAPDVPTITEGGVDGVLSSSWFGFFVPAGTPDAIQEKIYRDVSESLQSSSIKPFLTESGLALTGMSRQDFVDFIRNEKSKWQRVFSEKKIGSK